MGSSSKSPKKQARRTDVAVHLKAVAIASTRVASHTPFVPIGGGAAKAPPSVLLNIASYFYSAPFDKPSHGDACSAGYYLGILALERSKALRAMSQTCKAWRDALVPWLWRSFECGAIVRPESECQWFMQCVDRLISKCGGLAVNPELAQHTREIRVVLSKHRLDEAFTQFAKCLSVCVNLKVINIHFAQAETAGDIKIAFGGLEFPTVETVILPTQAHHLLRCCPNVKTVMCHQGDGSQIITAMQRACRNVEVIIGIRCDRSLVERLVKAGPNLRVIRFGWAGDLSTPELLELVKPLKALKRIQIGRSQTQT